MSVVQSFIEKFEDYRPIFAKEVRRTYEAEQALFEELAIPMLQWAEAALGDNYMQTLIEGYCEFVVDVNRSQAAYEKTGRYPHSSYQEVYEATYDSPEFMQLYHWGVYTTTFVWLHHLELYRFYRDDFLSLLKSDKSEGKVLDLGAGSGIWHFLFLRNLAGWSSSAVDISETSVEMAEKMAATIIPDRNTQYHVSDALTFRGEEAFDAGVSCFLLEHLETPDKLFSNLNENLKPGAFAFITGALTAAEIDHIYEFTYESQVLQMAEKAGFRVIKTFSSAPLSIPSSKKYLPRSMGLIMQKRHNDIW